LAKDIDPDPMEIQHFDSGFDLVSKVDLNIIITKLELKVYKMEKVRKSCPDLSKFFAFSIRSFLYPMQS